jgi:hypothetical protein
VKRHNKKILENWHGLCFVVKVPKKYGMLHGDFLVILCIENL